MSNKEKIIAFAMGGLGLILLGIGAIALINSSSSLAPNQALGSSQVNISAFASSSVFVMSAGTDYVIAPTSSGRQYFRVTNNSSVPIYLTYGTTTVNNNSGVEILAPTTTITFNYDNLFIGAIHAQPQSGSATATVIFFNQRH